MTKYYVYKQSNPGGCEYYIYNKKITAYIFIEANTPKESNKIAKSIGIYFDGVKNGIDCSCCNDRWTPININSKKYNDPEEYFNESYVKSDRDRVKFIPNEYNYSKPYYYIYNKDINGKLIKRVGPIAKEPEYTKEEKESMKQQSQAMFSLFMNDGKADRLINATKILNERIKELKNLRK